MSSPIDEIRKLKEEIKTKMLTKETYELAKTVLEELEEIERRWGRRARTILRKIKNEGLLNMWSGSSRDD